MDNSKNISVLVEDIDSYIQDKKEFSFINGISILYKKEGENVKSLFWSNVDYVLDKYNMRRMTGCSSYVAKEYSLKALVYSSACK